MTRKDYKLIADAISILNLRASVKLHVASVIGDALQTENEKFDTTKFIDECLRRNI